MAIRIIPTNSIRTILTDWLKCTCSCQSRARALDTRWVRDYGPFFGSDKAGNLYLLDTMYYDVRAQNEQTERSNDDLIPYFILDFIRGENINPRSLRPPLILDGGDFFTDGEGVCFTSTETLLRNGSNKEDMNMLFKLYFGCMRTIYLRPLPGPTVKHVDMFF